MGVLFHTKAQASSFLTLQSCEAILPPLIKPLGTGSSPPTLPVSASPPQDGPVEMGGGT